MTQDREFIRQQQESQTDIDRINTLARLEREEVQRREAEGIADIERINATFTTSQLTPPAISENLADMPCLQPPN
jgi:hypothetical protein